ncbi:MAG: FecR domain-containing protein [Elusimicrobia bacterium]|nr:FecR domain-containing protein [Elusimicrobiota bacterium]
MRVLALLALLSGAASAAVPASPAGLTGIGVAAAVRGAVRAVAPGAAVGRVLSSGQPVYLNDHVTTGPGGGLQLLLKDQTTFTLGPNSDMVLDTFVYDPATSAGKVSARIVKGAFRFVTGKVARRDPANMQVALPVGTIGIRGTIVGGAVSSDRADVVLLGPGPDNDAQTRRGGITVFNAHGSVDIGAGGWGTTILAGSGPGAPYRLTLPQLNAILGPLNPTQGASTGGGGKTDLTASATHTSGEGAASGGLVLSGTLADQSASQPDASTFASQQTAASSQFAAWGDILAIPSGTGGYNGSGNWTGCTSCSTSNTPVSGTFTFAANVNFGTRQFTYVGISLSGGISDSVYNYGSPAISYASTAQAAPGATASYTLNATDIPPYQGADFTGSKIIFGGGGDPGSSATLQLNYKNTNTDSKATGTTTAPKGPTVIAG